MSWLFFQHAWPRLCSPSELNIKISELEIVEKLDRDTPTPPSETEPENVEPKIFSCQMDWAEQMKVEMSLRIKQRKHFKAWQLGKGVQRDGRHWWREGWRWWGRVVGPAMCLGLWKTFFAFCWGQLTFSYLRMFHLYCIALNWTIRKWLFYWKTRCVFLIRHWKEY